MSLIERLEAGLEQSEYWDCDTAAHVPLADVREAKAQLEAMQAEIDRLRGALERIANMPATGLYGGFRKPCVELARASLDRQGK